MIDTYSLFNFLLELNQESTIEIIKTYNNEGNKSTNLIFPLIRNNKKSNGLLDKDKKRISEQELRFVMTELFHFNNYLNLKYAVEVPTVGNYIFSGSNSRSGSTDLAFYNNSDQVLNIELKANNPKQSSFDKDVEKLVKENTPGAWCHILKNQDSGTLKSILNKLETAFKNYNIITKPLYFSFLIVEKKVLISRIGRDEDVNNFQGKSIFSFDYKAYAEFMNSSNRNGFIGEWKINRYF